MPVVRTLLFTGPGGSGTTTLAAAAAVRAARAGTPTLFLSRQRPPLPGLADVPGLEVRIVDGQAALERLWAGSVETTTALFPQLTLPPASSVVPPPGAPELALLAELARAQAGLVVVDAGAPEAATALVGLPSVLRWWLDQAMPPGVRALGAVRTAAVSSGALRRGPVDTLLAAVPALEELLAGDRLADPLGTGVCFVATPRPGAAGALRTTATALALHRLRPATVLTRVLPAGGPGEWWTQRAAEQEAVLAELADLAPLTAVPETAVVPADVDALAGLLGKFVPPTEGGLGAPVPERGPGGWQLAVPLPFADRSEVQLTRWSDDLVVTAGGTRRSLRLDPLLRRCQVTGGRLADPGTAAARLEVSFRPDPQQWPENLLAAEEGTP